MSAPIFLVSGFGRCGTSLVMQMLQAGGFPVSGEWPSFEGDTVLSGSVVRWARLAGRAVKALDPHRPELGPPSGLAYRAIWVERDFHQQARSQVKFARLLMGVQLDRLAVRKLAASYRHDLPRALAILQERIGSANIPRLSFEALLARPAESAQKLQDFVGRQLDLPAMAAIVRRRSAECYPGLLEAEMLREKEAS